MSIVSFGKEPEPIDECEIEAVRTVLRSGLFAEACPFLREGQKVRIVRGSLAGLEGILVKKKTQFRMVISVTMLQRSVSVEIDSDWIASAR
jgi:transcription antitermination factor NusG